eukprot:TRINITY_DN19741_c0_g1_i1.p1 TRINITY_DN19741_c0_g1~~TRINITY_DN19741_c0_g1_i1.p1  ORF type:complete len:356 (+),score=78.72 TRINITY_DN19741_c0_g1_i1:103-1170(+)
MGAAMCGSVTDPAAAAPRGTRDSPGEGKLPVLSASQDEGSTPALTLPGGDSALRSSGGSADAAPAELRGERFPSDPVPPPEFFEEDEVSSPARLARALIAVAHASPRHHRADRHPWLHMLERAALAGPIPCPHGAAVAAGAAGAAAVVLQAAVEVPSPPPSPPHLPPPQRRVSLDLPRPAAEVPVSPPPARAEVAPQRRTIAELSVVQVAPDAQSKRTTFAVRFRLTDEDYLRTVLRHYTDFAELRDRSAPRGRQAAPSAPFPGKTIGKCKGEQLEQRRQLLEAWLLQACDLYWPAAPLRDFLLGSVQPPSGASPAGVRARSLSPTRGAPSPGSERRDRGRSVPAERARGGHAGA